MRILAGVEYNGSAYYGWQAQNAPLLNTIQAQCEAALSQVADTTIQTVCAGRTDKGVHALGQVIHFDTLVQRRNWVAGANHYLPTDIRLLWAKQVEDHLHARHSAIARRYRYCIYNHPIRPALLQKYVSWYVLPLSIALMRTGAIFLEGEHDFSAFRSPDCQAKTTIRHIKQLTICQEGHYIFIDVIANAFLHRMVRNIVGVLLLIGQGKKSPEWAKAVLASRSRSERGITASAEGLYLTGVYYPSNYQIPLPQLNR